MTKNYRDARTGQYTTAADAAARPAETVAAIPTQQHLWHPDGGAWCGAAVTNDPGVAYVRPRVPVCAACHIKAMHYRADLLDSAESALAHMTEARDNARAEVERLTAMVADVRETAEHYYGQGYANGSAAVLRIIGGEQS